MAKRIGPGRPSIYSSELIEEICTRIAGGESLRSICRDADMPAMSTVLLWVVDGKHPEFSEQYAQAREAQGHSDADRIREVMAAVAEGQMTPQQGKVIIDGLKWIAERQAPKQYAARSERKLEMSGPGGAPIGFNGKFQIEFVGDDDDEDEG